MNPIQKSFARGILIFLTLTWAGVVSASPISDRMLKLLQEGKMTEVYQLGLKHVFKEGGNVDFDFAFGIAAVRIGRPGRAIFALERVLWRQPDNHRARLELALAQFNLGNIAVARDEFREVLAHNPPENVRKNVETYLARIKLREKAQGTRFRTYVEANYVYDTNLNAAVSETEIAVPALGWVTLDPMSLAQEGSVYEINAAIDIEKLISKKSALFGTLKASSRTVPENESFSSVLVDLSGGIMLGTRKNRVRFPVQLSQFYVAGKDYRQMAFIGSDWTKSTSNANEIATFLQAGFIHYSIQKERNVKLAVLGGAWSHRFGPKGHVYSLAAHFGTEQVEDSNFPWWGRSYYGVRTGIDWKLGSSDKLYASVVYQKADHSASDPVFLVTRADQLVQLTAGWSRLVGEKTALKAEVVVTNNDTNIDIYTYERTQFMLGAKYQF